MFHTLDLTKAYDRELTAPLHLLWKLGYFGNYREPFGWFAAMSFYRSIGIYKNSESSTRSDHEPF